MSINWNSSYSVNVKEIDEQHQYFIGLLNKLYDAISELKDRIELKKILDELTAYASLHFKTEEKYFDKFHYENSAEHKEEHRKLTEKILDFNKRFESGEVEISEELLDFLEDWLVNHLDGQDKKYTKCFNENGLC